MHRVIVVHGWGGSPEGDWIPWIKRELKRKGYEVFVPVMPDTDSPKVEAWLAKLTEVVGKPRRDDTLIGHSIGTLAIINYLQTLKKGDIVNKVILVAPWHSLTLGEDEDPKIAKPWINNPVDWEKVKTKADKFTTIFSADDPWVPFEENKRFFEKHLKPQIIVKNKMGHFTEDEGFTKLPLLLQLI